MSKRGNRFVNSLDLGYVLHHCNTEKLLMYLHDVTGCVYLIGNRIVIKVIVLLLKFRDLR